MDNVMKLRLEGLPHEVDMALRALRNDPPSWLDVGAVSDPYPNRRGPGVRVYVHARVVDPLSATGEPLPTTTEEG